MCVCVCTVFVDARENNNFIFSHACSVVFHYKNGNIKKANVSTLPISLFLFDCKHCTRTSSSVWHHFQCWFWLVITYKSDEQEREWKRARSVSEYNGKMSQEIKTPSIVNLHNELCARFPVLSIVQHFV